MTESHNCPPLPWERAEWADAQAAHDALLARATTGRDTVEALAWLGRFDETDSEARVTVRSALRARLTDAEWALYAIWREGTAAYLTRAVAAKHARRVMLKVAA